VKYWSLFGRESGRDLIGFKRIKPDYKGAKVAE